MGNVNFATLLVKRHQWLEHSNDGDADRLDDQRQRNARDRATVPNENSV
jgi:hypothetical protein